MARRVPYTPAHCASQAIAIMNETPDPIEPETPEPRNQSQSAPTLPHAIQKSDDDNPPPLYVSGFGVMGQSTPDVATGSTPVTRHDD